MTDQALVPGDTIELRLTQANDIIKRNMLWSAGAGVLPVPLLELVAITGLELKLIKELADLYGAEFRKGVAKSIVLSLVGSLGSVTIGQALALSGLRAIPILGQVVGLAAIPGMAAALTYAVGKVFVMHFEAGGTLLDFNPAEMRDYFREHFAAGLKDAANKVAPPAQGKPAS